jgi:lactate 2-monooxygenase
VLSSTTLAGSASQLWILFKALALAARAVLLGRLYTWGLAVVSEPGVRDVLLNLLADLDLTPALSGHTSRRTLDASVLSDLP